MVAPALPGQVRNNFCRENGEVEDTGRITILSSLQAHFNHPPAMATRGIRSTQEDNPVMRLHRLNQDLLHCEDGVRLDA